MANTHWRKLSNTNYLGAYSLDDGKDIVLTIKNVQKELVTGPDGKKEDCIVCHWMENEKPMILNVTNCRTISKLLGTPYIEQWSGHKVQIGIEAVSAFGTVTDALRIRKEKPVEEAPVACEDCGSVIQPAFGMTASQWAQYSKKKMGRCLCESCANKAAEAAKK